MEYVLGVDLGTSSLKGVVINQNGELVDTQTSSYELMTPQPSYSEQNPNDWITAFDTVLMKLIENNPDLKHGLLGISFSGQMHSLVMLDENDEVIRPAILWNDTRNTEECLQITSEFGEQILQINGNAVLEGFTLPKILWVQKHEPKNWEKTKTILLPKDYLTMKLTNEKVMDVTDAAGTLLLDTNVNEWSNEILDKFSISREMLPKVVNTGSFVGNLCDEYSQKFGFDHEVSVYAGAADNVCSAISSGVVSGEQAMLSIGTSGVLLRYEDKKRVDYKGKLHVFSYAIPDTYYSMGVTLAAGFSLKWLKGLLEDAQDFAAFTSLAKTSPIGSNGLLFTPYIMGERTPYSDGDIRGSFIGLNATQTKGDLIHAVLEGVVFSLRDVKELMDASGQSEIKRIVSVGGGAKNKQWLQIQADILDTEIVTLNVEEGPGVGAGMLAAVGCGWFEGLVECAEAFVSYKEHYLPQKENAKLYDKYYSIYKKIYFNTKDLSRELAEIVRRGVSCMTEKMFKIEKNLGFEKLVIEAYGTNGIRVRSTPLNHVNDLEGALAETSQLDPSQIKITDTEDGAELINGKARVCLDHRNRLTFYDDKGNILLKEFIRLRAVKHDDGSEDAGSIEVTKDFNSTLKLKAREYKAHFNSELYKITTRFESDPNEKIYGMGQYQQPYLNLKNTVLELAPRNSQISIPFYVSSKGYGFLWNNPGLGKVTFAKNVTEWEMNASDFIDYWVTVGDSPADIMTQYTEVSGRAPKMPKELLGLWQSKLRYRTEQDVLDVVKKYHDRGIKLSSIAIDYFHWPKQGEYRFDRDWWPTIEKTIDEVQNVYGVNLIVSVWPTVQSDAANYQDYASNGYLINVNRGVQMTMQIQGNTVFIDMTNKDARDYVRKLIDENYGKLGIKYYWLDVAEPGYSVYDFDNYRYFKGPDEKVGNLYSVDYIKMITENNPYPVALVRGGWAGVQKYGALIWSGDIDSSFEAFKNQVNTGLNMGMAGIPWWTTDIGGFHGGCPEDGEFRELMLRWFEYATFSPILRMHGDRQPHSKPLSSTGGGAMVTGAPNEIWSYGASCEKVFMKYLKIRKALEGYLDKLMQEASQNGSPLMRPLFYHYPEDEKAWEYGNDIYLFGDSLIVAPITNFGQTEREVYLPEGDEWIYLWDYQKYAGGHKYSVKAQIDEIPVFVREDQIKEFDMLFKLTEDE